MTDSLSTAATELRTKQKPLKDKYRNTPESAFITLSSTGSLNDPSSFPTCSLSTASAAKRVAGLHPAAGGPGQDELCSGDMLLESLVACFGVTVRAVATSLSIPIQSGTITAEGDLDFRGTLGIKDPNNSDPIPVGFQAIRLIVSLDVGGEKEHEDKVEKLISLSERYCVVLQTIKVGTKVQTKLDRDNAEIVGGKTKNVDGVDGKSIENGQGGGELGKVLSSEEVLQLN